MHAAALQNGFDRRREQCRGLSVTLWDQYSGQLFPGCLHDVALRAVRELTEAFRDECDNIDINES